MNEHLPKILALAGTAALILWAVLQARKAKREGEAIKERRDVSKNLFQDFFESTTGNTFYHNGGGDYSPDTSFKYPTQTTPTHELGPPFPPFP